MHSILNNNTFNNTSDSYKYYWVGVIKIKNILVFFLSKILST